MKLKIAALAATLALTGACSKIEHAPAAAAEPAPVQDKVCEVRGWQSDVTAECKPGQKIVFLPNTFGNEQLPILFAAVNCDMRYTVAMTNGGVVCIHAKLQAEKPAQTTPAAPSQGASQGTSK